MRALVKFDPETNLKKRLDSTQVFYFILFSDRQEYKNKSHKYIRSYIPPWSLPNIWWLCLIVMQTPMWHGIFNSEPLDQHGDELVQRLITSINGFINEQHVSFRFHQVLRLIYMIRISLIETTSSAYGHLFPQFITQKSKWGSTHVLLSIFVGPSTKHV